MPMAAFGRKPRWFGDEGEEDGPTPLFPPGVIGTDQQSMFPVKSDANPVMGALKSGWKGLGDWLNAPASSAAGQGDDLLGYKPTSRIQAISDALGGAARGVLGSKGPGNNWFGQGVLGASEGLEQSRDKDLKLRQLAQEQQYKQASASLAKVKAATAEKLAEHAGEYTIGRTRFDPEGKPIVTAPPDPMDEAEKLRLQQGDERLALDRTQAEQRAAEERARQKETAGYHASELAQGRERLGLSREEMKQREALAGQATEAGKSAGERDRTRMVGISNDLAAGRDVKPEDKAWYERAYREVAQDRTTFDPTTGLTTTVKPDITDLAQPPTQAGKPAPTPGATMAQTLPPREHLETARKAGISTKTSLENVDRLEKLMSDATPAQLMGGDTAAKLNAEMLAFQASMGGVQNSGVLQPSDIENIKATLGSPTGYAAGLKAEFGSQPFKAALKQYRTMATAGLRARAVPLSSDEQAKSIPPGIPYIKPDGSLWEN